jgi:acyl-CoA reductase-like NAD-dependent aldehyde dehydrogenase
MIVPGAATCGAPLEVRSPWDGARLADVQTADAAALEQALANATALFADRDAWLPVHERAAVLDRLGGLVAERAEELALLAAQEGGKPLVDSRIELARAIDGLKLCVSALRAQAGVEVPMSNAAAAGRLAFTTHEPRGVVAAISAFNHPFNLIVHQAGPAIAAGCPVIVKPAEVTPLSALRFTELALEAGLPEAWCQCLVPDSLELVRALAADERVAFLSFIGSAAVGWELRSALAPGARCTLEHGGASPVIVAADADLDFVLPGLVKGAFYHAGQVCVSVQRVFAERSIARELAERIAAAARELVVGDPCDPATEVGPLIRASALERVAGWVDAAVAGGAERLCGGERVGETCYAPTVLFDPPPAAEVCTAELFGPVVCVTPYDDEAAAVARANELPFAFQAAVCTRDLDRALRISRRLAAAAVMVNDHTAFRVDWMPFGGYRHSGLGTGGIGYTLDDYSIEKLIVVRSREL